MFLSIVIPTCRRHGPLVACQRQLDSKIQQVPESEYEILVSDDGAEESLHRLLAAQFPRVKWAAGPQRGPAANRNAGAARATGEWLLFLDDDCVPAPSLLAAYRAAIAGNPTCRVLEGAVIPDRSMQRMDEEAPLNDTGGCLWSCNFAIRRDFFAELGGFCEAFPYAALEDVDLRERLKQKGEIFLFVRGAEVRHAWRPMPLSAEATRRQILSHRVLYGRYPEMRPSFLGSAIGLIRYVYRYLAVEGRAVRFRGLGRWCLRVFVLGYEAFYFVFMRAIPPPEKAT